MKHFLSLIFICFLSFQVFAEKADSVGTKVKNGKVYILHKVEKGQGLYSISKKYSVSLTELIAENPGSEELIKVDQIIWVPTELPVKLEEPVVEEFFEKTEGVTDDGVVDAQLEESSDITTYASYHVVQKGETLYAIARKYNTSVDVIKSLNDLGSDMISEGQKLLVPGGVEENAANADSSRFEVELDEVAEELDIPDVEEVIEEAMEEEVEVEGYSIKVIRMEEYDLEKVEETGSAIIDAEKVPSNKNFAYHFNAPIGTVIMVTNPENNKTVFVKVVGNFNRSSDSAVILKLSKLSAETIGLGPGGTPVNLSYAR